MENFHDDNWWKRFIGDILECTKEINSGYPFMDNIYNQLCLIIH